MLKEATRNIKNIVKFVTMGFLLDHYHGFLDWKLGILNPDAREQAWKLAHEAKLAEIRGEKYLQGLPIITTSKIAGLNNVGHLQTLDEIRFRRQLWMRKE